MRMLSAQKTYEYETDYLLIVRDVVWSDTATATTTHKQTTMIRVDLVKYRRKTKPKLIAIHRSGRNYAHKTRLPFRRKQTRPPAKQDAQTGLFGLVTLTLTR